MNPKFDQITVWPESRRLFDVIMAHEVMHHAALGATRVMVMHRLLVEECGRRGIAVPEPPTARKDGEG